MRPPGLSSDLYFSGCSLGLPEHLAPCWKHRAGHSAWGGLDWHLIRTQGEAGAHEGIFRDLDQLLQVTFVTRRKLVTPRGQSSGHQPRRAQKCPQEGATKGPQGGAQCFLRPCPNRARECDFPLIPVGSLGHSPEALQEGHVAESLSEHVQRGATQQKVTEAGREEAR